MQRKDSEQALGTMMRQQDYFVHKWRDRGFVSCPHCHKVVTICPHCGQSLLMAKAQTYPDFLVALNYAYIECKQGTESWSLTDISITQEETLDSINNSWVFLLIGTGRLPRGKHAFLIPWEAFKDVRKVMFRDNMKSVRFAISKTSTMPTAQNTFGPYQLNWGTGAWEIPIYHPWWGGAHERSNSTFNPAT